MHVNVNVNVSVNVNVNVTGGLPWGEVVSWYCHQHQQELTSEEDLSNMQKLVNQVRCGGVRCGAVRCGAVRCGAGVLLCLSAAGVARVDACGRINSCFIIQCSLGVRQTEGRKKVTRDRPLAVSPLLMDYIKCGCKGNTCVSSRYCREKT